ncbi:PREDICTED: phosphatidate phosphatase LPIN2-like isoform X2 [Priapulus caudatus]|uniref:phosphatidate phosphatase n=1 Tax=Priapulus caudatus TaxID=37621 RepID=A0ABM1EQY9_PRICU|nr:PREDICTED: phosphatidate phosphatase LPIN2-like isoform X2 [Priapulus caudatus]
MNYVYNMGKLLINFKDFYNEINAATLTGAIDIVVVKQEDGTLCGSPFHVRFGKMGVLRSREKVVEIAINEEQVNIQMKLGESGEAFFVEEIPAHLQIPPHLATSPIPSSSVLSTGELHARLMEIEKNSCDTPEEGATCRVIVAGEARVSDGSVSSPDGAGAQLPKQPQHFDVFDSPDKGSSAISLPNETVPGSLEGLAEAVETTSEATPETTLEATSETTPEATPETAAETGAEMVAETETETETEEGTETGVEIVADAAETPAETVVVSGVETQTESLAETSLIASTHETSPETSADSEVEARDDDGDGDAAADEDCDREVSEACDVMPNRSATTQTEGPAADYALFASSDTRGRRRRRKRTVARARVKSSLRPEAPDLAGDFGEDIFQFDGDDEGACEHPPPDSGEVEVEAERREPTGGLPGAGWRRDSYLDFHPFSDGDITPTVSPANSRPPSPKSDTEYEREAIARRHDATCQTPDEMTWLWGELPARSKSEATTPVNADKTASADLEEQQRWLGSMFQFMRKTKKIRRQASDGIYLDELSLTNLDPDTRALYFPKRDVTGRITHLAELTDEQDATSPRHVTSSGDEDDESGNGPSLPRSPGSFQDGVDSVCCSCGQTKAGFTSKCFDRPTDCDDLAISLCGGLAESDMEITEERFMQYLVTYQEFCANPTLLSNPDTVFRIRGRYVNSHVAVPGLMCHLLFQNSLPQTCINELIREYIPKKKKEASRKTSWFPWRRSISSVNDEDGSKEIGKKEDVVNKYASTAATTEEIPTTTYEGVDIPGTGLMANEEVDGLSSDTEQALSVKGLPVPVEYCLTEDVERFKKSIRLSPEQLAKLNLQPGPNEITFSVTTKMQGTTRCYSTIYLWNYDDKLVISDVDGTITKSDVLGHVLPYIGKDWAQSGVTQLFNAITENGYKFVYLSARAIGQFKGTKDYLKSIKQGDVSLPDGPLLLNPSSLLSALHREVIERNPEKFKIQCLRDIKALFPTNPFYAGYGNRINDTWAYRTVGVPTPRIFTINPKGELKYSGQSDLVDHLFPHLHEKDVVEGTKTGTFPASDQFSLFTFWRPPILDVELPPPDPPTV